MTKTEELLAVMNEPEVKGAKTSSNKAREAIKSAMRLFFDKGHFYYLKMWHQMATNHDE